MSSDPQIQLLQTILESIISLQERIEMIDERTLSLDRKLSGLTDRSDPIPALKGIVDRMNEDRSQIVAGFGRLAALGAFTHAAASGSRVALPVGLVDDAAFELFTLTQPADHSSQERALVEWRARTKAAGTAELAALLAQQYVPSPTDTPETRVLRYRLAAISRDELAGRGAVLPAVPSGTIAHDRSVVARKARSEDLARLWRSGASDAMYAEAELAGAADFFERGVAAFQGTMSEEELAAELATLHRELGVRIENGERHWVSGQVQAIERKADIEAELSPSIYPPNR
jgi:hypothetical protein